MGTSYAVDIEQLLEEGHTIRIKPQGYSMYPFLVSGRDAALIEKVPVDTLKKGDVVLYRRDDSILVLHRICRVTQQGFYMVGDNQSEVEGPLRPDQIRGKMVAFERKNHSPVSVDAIAYRLLSGIWLSVLPLRPVFWKLSALIRKIYPFLIVLLIVLAVFLFYRQWSGSASYVSENFSVSNSSLSNPYIGMYTMKGITLSDDKQPDLPKISEKPSEEGLVLMEVNLKAFSDRDLSKKALDELKAVFSAYQSSGNQLIVRFLYDWNGRNLETEPDTLEQILRHMSQTAEIVNEYKDTVYILQGLFMGDCGEMHHSRYANEEDMKILAEHWASVTDPDIFLSVRTPAQLRTILGTDGIPDEKIRQSGGLAARLGLFNDGMLGSGSDVGTYGDKMRSEAAITTAWIRADEIDFQNDLCQWVPNGGEVIQDNPYNDLENAVNDLTAMHVSYLNQDYDTDVFEKWRQGVYEGENGYDYIASHLGYRYVLKKSEYQSEKFKKAKGNVKIEIENAGFACCYRSFDVNLKIVSENGEISQNISADTDTRSWQPAQITTLTIPVDFGKLPSGKYQLYLSLTDTALDRNIYFANELKMNEDGYRIGEIDLQ